MLDRASTSEVETRKGPGFGSDSTGLRLSVNGVHKASFRDERERGSLSSASRDSRQGCIGSASKSHLVLLWMGLGKERWRTALSRSLDQSVLWPA